MPTSASVGTNPSERTIVPISRTSACLFAWVSKTRKASVMRFSISIYGFNLNLSAFFLPNRPFEIVLVVVNKYQPCSKIAASALSPPSDFAASSESLILQTFGR